MPTDLHQIGAVAIAGNFDFAVELLKADQRTARVSLQSKGACSEFADAERYAVMVPQEDVLDGASIMAGVSEVLASKPESFAFHGCVG